MQPEYQCLLTDGDLVANQVLMTNALMEVLDAREFYEHPERPILHPMAMACAYQALTRAEVALDKRYFTTAMKYATLAVAYINQATGRVL